jgi:hypothetical protein
MLSLGNGAQQRSHAADAPANVRAPLFQNTLASMSPRPASRPEQIAKANESQQKASSVLDTRNDTKEILAEEKKEEKQSVDSESVGDDASGAAGIWTSLEAACAELGYSLDELARFLRTASYPPELLALVKAKSCLDDASEVKLLLEPQRPLMLSRVESSLKQIEEARQRRLEEERQARDAAAKELLRVQREKEARTQERLRRLGVCPMHYQWLPQSGGYRCAGGSHFVTEAQVNYIDEK